MAKRRAWAALGLMSVGLAACSAPAEPDPPPRRAPDNTLVETPTRPEPPVLPDAVIAERDALLEIAGDGRLRAFSRRAAATDGFVSNFADDDHYDHWYLLRQTGVDPLAQFQLLFEQPHAARQVGQETWYIWPDLAALSAEDLLLERLSFQDRARLTALIGEDGVQRIRAGSAYPGFRTAIAADGRWVYFLHEIGGPDDEGVDE
ncbi:MAG: hypothetical protein AAGJ29_03040 [Pseudomonadota bacterium]